MVQVHQSTEGRIILPTMLRFPTPTHSTLGVSDGLEVAHPYAVLGPNLVALPLLHHLSVRFGVLGLIHLPQDSLILKIDRAGDR